jgi:hypothetical protein
MMKLSLVTDRRLTVSAGYASASSDNAPGAANSQLRQARTQILRIHVAKFVVRRDRQFERRALQVVDQNFQIVRLDKRVFRRIPKKIIRVPNNKLV